MNLQYMWWTMREYIACIGIDRANLLVQMHIWGSKENNVIISLYNDETYGNMLLVILSIPKHKEEAP